MPHWCARACRRRTLSLLGLVRHMTFVEWSWFEHVFAGDRRPQPISTDDDTDADFNDLDPDRGDGGHRRGSCASATCPAPLWPAPASSTSVAARHGTPVSLRWIMVHMIEEYARHNGHADLLRELIDGAVGE